MLNIKINGRGNISMNFIIDRDESVNNLCGYDIEHRFVNSFSKEIIQPHEWIFIYRLYRLDIVKNQNLAKIFIYYCDQYYPNYSFHMSGDPLTTVSVECSIYDMLFEQVYEFGIKNDMNKAMEFGDIVTNFYIRYLKHNLIGLSGQKIIITSLDNCHKRFESYLKGGGVYNL